MFLKMIPGIPYDYFDKSGKWNIKLYGQYLSRFKISRIKMQKVFLGF